MTPAECLYAARNAFSKRESERGQTLCETLLKEFPDSPEAKDAEELLRLSNPERMSQTDDAPSEAELQVAEFYAQLKRLTPYAFVTPALVLINVGVFVVMIVGGVDLMSPSIEHLLSWGANYAPKTTGGEWWRLLSSNYVHIGIIHIAVNMYVLWDAGLVVERLLGNVGFIIMYVLSGVLGSFTSVLWDPAVVSAGASGAVFGVYGCLIGFLLLSRGSIPNQVLKHITGTALAFVAYNVFISIGEEGIDMAAHVGGFATGFLCGVMMRLPLVSGSVNRRWARNGIVGGVGTAVIALAIGSGLGHVADVEGALLRFGEFEERVSVRFSDMMQRAEAGELSEAQVSVRLNQQILAPWRGAREAFERMDDVPIQQKPLFDTFVAYMNLREEAWRLLSEGLKTGNEEMANSFQEKWQEADQLIIEMAAEQRDAEAQFELGVMYATGQGVAQDYEEAVRWYRMAAEQGLANAQHVLGVAYGNGVGVAQDYEEAVRQYRAAAEQGHAGSQANLSLLYANGQGVAQDYAEAYAWIAAAAAQGQVGAEEARQELLEVMTRSQVERAEELAREYQEKYVTR